MNYGGLSGGLITVESACLGGTVRFSVSGVTDSGGESCIGCIAPVQPSFTWLITGPGTNANGTGPTAEAPVNQPGDYACTFTATASRACAPPPLTIGPQTATAVALNLEYVGVTEANEENPGGFLCVNDDDDNNNGALDKDEPGATMGEDDLHAMSLNAGNLDASVTVTLSAVSGGSKIKVYENPDRTMPVTLPAIWPGGGVPNTVYVEGIAASTAARDVELKLEAGGASVLCADIVKLTVIRAELNPVTSGIEPVPINPAIVAPVDIGLNDGTTFNEGNKFELTTLQPDIDLSILPVSWVFELNSGSIDHNVLVDVDADRRGARLDFPLISSGNFGTGRMLFVLGVPAPGSVPVPCASIDTLVRNIMPDIEQKDFRFPVKAHLCHDGQGNGTTRTQAEIIAIVSDVTKVLSQAGVIVTTSSIVTTQIDPDFINLDSTALFDMWLLFGTDEDESAIDIFFVSTIDYAAQISCGQTAGVTGTPAQSGIYEAGIAIADSTCDGPLTGQTVARTVAHEITHYLLNHEDPSNDHVGDPNNLMDAASSNTKRDLDQDQCLELRTNSGED